LKVYRYCVFGIENKCRCFFLGSAKRWKKFVESEAPEKEKFPQEWKSKSSLQKLCLMRALRPDRMLYALSLFVEEKLGRKYVENRTIEC
jgi:dynein heavy chain